jgi:hypothetical protein
MEATYPVCAIRLMQMQPFSLSVALIEMRRGDTCGATGSAFFFKHEDALVLITNWHNVTGINAATEKPLHKDGLLPTSLRVHYKQFVDVDGGKHIQSNCLDVPLYAGATPVWLEHSSGRKVDVVAIPLDESRFENMANRAINLIDQESRLSPEAGMECFILGFPEGLIGPARTPIWKRGSIAIEVHSEKLFYYVDSATRKGMSGAPVIARHSGYISFGATMSGDSIIGTVEKFVGIYSGRVGDDALGYQLGLVWKTDVLVDIMSGKTAGSSPLDAT